MSKRIIVLHRMYGCESGCCGHVVNIEDDGEERERFCFEHPFGKDFETWARALVESEFPGHGADLDFANCYIEDE